VHTNCITDPLGKNISNLLFSSKTTNCTSHAVNVRQKPLFQIVEQDDRSSQIEYGHHAIVRPPQRCTS